MRAADFASLPRNIALIAALSTAIAAGIALARQGGFVESLIYSQCIGLGTLLAIDVPRRLLWGAGQPPRLRMIALSTAGMLAGFAGGVALATAITGRPLVSGSLLSSIAIALFAGIAANWYFHNRERVAHMRLDAERVERGAVEARLKLLQAQIEPHFLFNTLANLHSLIDADPARAQKMLEHLNDYLRATLDAARRDSGTLGEEFALLRGYLEVLGIRMGPRLEFSLNLPEQLSKTSLPPMLLQPLVENAVKHGLEPKIDGGRVDVSASKEGDSVCIRISDTGLGNVSTKGSGVGLEHVRERLAAAYGGSASLEMHNNPSGGMTVTVRIPSNK